jgi:hypothetical protein
VRPGIGQRKIPKNISRIEKATFRLEAQCLNQLGDRDVGIPKYREYESLESEPCAFQIGMANVELKRYKTQRIEEIPAELIRIGSTTRSEIHTIINSICKMNELLILKEDISLLKTTSNISSKICVSILISYANKNLLGITGVYFDVPDIIVYWSHVLGSSNTL